MIRILIADDANLIRQALNIYFQLESDLEIVGTAENGKIALKLTEELNPDIVLMDMEMPEMDGLNATNIICQRFPRTKVLIITSHDSQDYINKALKAGAKGYFIKSKPTEELLEAIKLIHKRDVRIIPALSTEESYLVLPDSLSCTNSIKSRLSSLVLVATDKFLPFINSAINRWVIVILFMFGMFGVAIFLASILKYQVKVRADAQIYSTSEIIEEWKKYQQIAKTGAVSRSPINEKRAAFKEKQINLQQLKSDRVELQHIDNTLPDSNIRAPIADNIKQLHLSNQQQLVDSGDLIAKIYSSRVPLLVKASVTSQDIAKVEKEQKVQLKVFACPYTHYGTLQGKTIAISSPISQPVNQADTPISQQNIKSVDATYEVTIEPANISLNRNKQKCQLKSGMKAQADIITQEETILTLILHKAKSISN